MTTIEDIIKKAKTYIKSKRDLDKIRKSYLFAKKAHKGQIRFSGEPYIQHPVEATMILLDLHPDIDTIIACLLHDVPEDTPLSIKDIKKKFGNTVSHLVEGMEKLSKVYSLGEDRYIENLRKMFLAMADDIRVILIKFSDRLHNLQTLEYVRPDKQRRIAKETLDIYAPLADRLGIYRMKTQIEDLCFFYLYPENYKDITSQLKKHKKMQNYYINLSAKNLKKILQKENIKTEINGRIKHLYSIYTKLKRKNKNYITDIYDIFALRIIVENENDCYKVLGILHKNWTPLSYRFKDYIAVPKPNSYQSLHTTLIGLLGKKYPNPVEIQIRTQKMHIEAELGIAAHWQYKEKGYSFVIPEKNKEWILGLVNLQDTLRSNREFKENLKLDTFKDRIFVLTPKGDVKDLPQGAIPIDFAYTVHTSIGHRFKGAKVNGNIVSLGYRLKNGDVVEIITKRKEAPSLSWISLAVTGIAKSKIKSWFNQKTKDDMLKMGLNLINKQLARFSLSPLTPKLTQLRHYHNQDLSFRKRETILEKIGNGSLSAASVVREIIDTKKYLLPSKRQRIKLLSSKKKKPKILVSGEKNIKTVLAKCCSPDEKSKIIGYITTNNYVSIHRKNCKTLKKLDKRRFIKASFEGAYKNVTLYFESEDRVGLLHELTGIISGFGLNIVKVQNQVNPLDNKASMEITIEMENPDILDSLINNLENIESIKKVYQKGK